MKAFDDLSAVATKVINYDLESPDLAKDMVAFRIEMGRQQSSSVSLTVKLLTQFKDLGTTAAGNIGTLLGKFLATIDSVAYHVGQPETTPSQRAELQGALALASGGYLVYSAPVVSLLNCLLDYGDSGSKVVCGFTRTDGLTQIVGLADALQAELDELDLQGAEFGPLFAISSPPAQSYNALDRELSLWLAEDPSRPVTDFPKYGEMVRLLESIDRGAKLRAADVSHPREYLLRLADYFNSKFLLTYHSPAPDCNPQFEKITACFPRPSAPAVAGG